MVDLIYRFTGPPPARSGDVVKIGTWFYEVLEVEPLYYAFTPPGGFQTLTYLVDEIIPSSNYIHYIVSVGANAPVSFLLNYPSGRPRQTPGANATQRLPSAIASFLTPWTVEFAILKGDTLELDVDTGGGVVPGSIWFYGWKWTIRDTKRPADGKFKVPQDFRRSE